MRALIWGVGGQDGSYLSRLLLGKEYEVICASRDAMASSFSNLKNIGILDAVFTTSMTITSFRSVLQTLVKHHLAEIYNLAGQSSVGLSLEKPMETMESIAIGTLNLLKAIRFYGKPIRLYNAGFNECFGETGAIPANEETPLKLRSPYAVAKASAHNLVANYCEAYSLYACTGILFNHGSPLCPERFVTQKTVRTAVRFASGSNENWKWETSIYKGTGDGHLNILRKKWKMLQQNHPGDFVIATGKTITLEFFIEYALQFFRLNYKDYLVISSNLYRPTDIHIESANLSKAKLLAWHSQVKNLRQSLRTCASRPGM